MNLTAEGCAARRRYLLDSVDANFIIITNPRHIFYFTGLYISPLALSSWGSNFLIIDPYTNTSTLLVHNFLADAAKAAHVEDVQVWTWYDAAQNSGVPIFSAGVDELNLRLPVGGTRIAAEKGLLPWDVGATEVLDITPTILEMRRQKYADELALIRAAMRVNAAGHRAAREVIRPGITELDVYNAIHAGMVREAGHAVLLMGDFASGERAFQGGGVATERVLEAGDLMILDLFPLVNGYRADYTVTLSVDGKLTPLQKQVESVLQNAIEAGEALLKPDMPTRDIYHALRGAMEQRDHKFAVGFTHHGGHGLGLGHPEAPYLVPNSEEVLVAGDVITMEPGTYSVDEGFGARIENNYLITQNGFEKISQHSTLFT